MKTQEMRLAIREMQLILAQAEEDGEVIMSPVFGPMFKIKGYKLTDGQIQDLTTHLKTLEVQLTSSTPWDV